MIKKIYITSGSGTSGKDTFAKMVDKYTSVYKHSIINLPKQAARILGWDGVSKTEKDRKFLSDIMDLASKYNDSPFKDVISIAVDFKNNVLEDDVLFVDMRDSKDIARAVEIFSAETILIRNPRIEKIKSNHADANVEKYEYDYIIENDGSLEQLDYVAKIFVRDIIYGNYIPDDCKPFIMTCSKY